MRRLFSLPWCLLALSGILVAAGPGPLLRKPERTETEKKKATAAAPSTPRPPAAKPATTAASKPAPAKPAARPAFQVAGSPPAKSRQTEEPVRTKGETASGVSGARLRPTDSTALRRFLSEWQPRLAASQQDLATFRERLVEGGAEIATILRDRSLSALASDQNRRFGAIPAAAAMRAHGQRDWLRHVQFKADRTPPARVEEVVRQAEVVALRLAASSAETRKLVARVGSARGVAAGGYLQMDAPGNGLLFANLRAIPGPFPKSAVRQPYAVQRVDALRAQFENRKTALVGQYRAVRQEWIAAHAQGEELAQRYAQLRTSLVAQDEP